MKLQKHEAPIVFNLNDNTYDMKDMMLKTMVIHNQIYRSKIVYNKQKMTMRMSPKNFVSKKYSSTQYQISDNHFTLKCPLTETEEKNLLLFEKRIIKMMGKKLMNDSCLKDLHDALNFFHSSLIYDKEKPYFFCKLSREYPDVEELVQSFCLYSNQEDNDSFPESYAINIMPHEVCFKPNKSLYVDYDYFVERMGNNDGDLGPNYMSEDHESENDNEAHESENDNKAHESDIDKKNEIGNEENNMQKDLKEDSKENSKEDSKKEYNDQNVQTNSSIDISENDIPENHENQENNEENKNIHTMNEYEQINQEYILIMKDAKQTLLKLKNKQDSIKGALHKYIDCVMNIISTFDEDSQNSQESIKDRERKEINTKRYHEKKEILKTLLK